MQTKKTNQILMQDLYLQEYLSEKFDEKNGALQQNNKTFNVMIISYQWN